MSGWVRHHRCSRKAGIIWVPIGQPCEHCGQEDER